MSDSDLHRSAGSSDLPASSDTDAGDRVRRMLHDVGGQLEELRRMSPNPGAAPAPGRTSTDDGPDSDLAAARHEIQQARAALDRDRAEWTAEFEKLTAAHELIEAEIEARKNELEERGARLESVMEQLQDSEQVDVNALVSARAKVEELNRDLEEAREAAVRAEAAKDEAQRQLSEARMQGADGDGERIAALEATIATLTAELKEAQASTSDEEVERAMNDLRRKAQRIAMVAAHLKRRRQRLTRLRRALRERGESVTGGGPISVTQRTEQAIRDREAAAATMRKLDTVRQELSDRRVELAEKERRMQRRWARPQAIIMSGWLVFMALVSGAIAWFGTDYLFPAVSTAVVTLEGRSRSPGALPEEQALAWQEWHVKLLAEPSFREGLLSRVTDRRLERYASAAAIARALDRDLSIDRTVPDQLVLTLAGSRPAELQEFLDLVATTVVTDSLAERKKRTNAVWAEARGEREERGRVVYSTLGPNIKDDRPLYAGIGFGVVLLVVSTLVGGMYGRLMKAKREFDGDEPAADSVYAAP